MLTTDDKSISLKYLLSVLNSKLILYYFKMIGSSSGMGTLEWTGVGTQKIPIPKIEDKNTISKFEILSDYIIELLSNSENAIFHHTDNLRISHHIDDILNMMVYELYFEEHMKAKEVQLDVLQFINPKPIANLKSDKEKAEIIKAFYLWLQTPDNAVRQRINIVDIKSPNILSKINLTTQ
jgi:hypothetical protein